nr:hypothetical protein [Tanacetum cinerariifolium]
MTTLAEHIIVAGAENRPPMLEKSMYDSWACCIRLFIKGKKHGRVMLDSVDNGPLVYPTIEENGQTRLKKYSELTKAEQLQDDCDVQATNIILHGLPPNVYVLVDHQEAAKAIWDKVKLLMKGTELSYQEHECRLYDLFDKFASVQGETFGEDSIDCINKALPFTSAVASRGIATTSKGTNATGQPWVLKCYNCQGEGHMTEDLDAYDSDCDDLSLAKEVLMDNISSCDSDVLFEGEDSIDCINKALPFTSAVASRGIATTSRGTNAAGQPWVLKCYNCQGEGHMARKCTHPKRPRNATWFKEKLMLAEAQEVGQILDEEQLAFLADLGMYEALVTQQIIP